LLYHILTSFVWSLILNKLRATGAGHDFLEGGMNFFQICAGVHTFGEYGSKRAIQAGTLDERADLEIKLIVWFSGNGVHCLFACYLYMIQG
jgi:hypothetical protein